jgi:hypothetical protein
MLVRIASRPHKRPKPVVAPSGGSEYAGYTPSTVVTDSAGLLSALASAVAGDIIGVDPGIYTATRTTKDNFPKWRATNSGSSGSPIRIVAKYIATGLESVPSNANRSELRHTGSDMASNGTCSGPIVGCNGEDYVEWVVFYVDESTSPTKQDNGPVVQFGSTGGRISHFVIDAITANWNDNHNGIRCENGDGLTITNNRINGVRNLQSSTHNAAGVMCYQVRGSTFAHNTISDCGSGLYFKGGFNDAHGYTVEYNRISDCNNGIICGQTGLAGGSNTTIDGGADNVCRYNLVTGSLSTNGGIKCAPDLTGSYNWKVHHNTVVSAAGSAIIDSSLCFDAQIYDNIFACVAASDNFESQLLRAYGHTPGVPVNDSFNNRYFSYAGVPRWSYNATYYSSIGDWQTATGEDVSSTYGDPEFEDRAGDDYRLDAASPCLTLSSTGGPVGCYITGSETIGVEAI